MIKGYRRIGTLLRFPFSFNWYSSPIPVFTEGYRRFQCSCRLRRCCGFCQYRRLCSCCRRRSSCRLRFSVSVMVVAACENTAFLFRFLLLFLQLLSDFFCFFNLTFFVTTVRMQLKN